MTDVGQAGPPTFRRAVRVAALDLLGAVLVAAVAVAATIATGLEVHAAVVLLLAGGLAGEQLYRRRDLVPSEVPKREIEATEVDEGPLRPWGDLATAFAVAAVLFAVGLVMLDGGGNILVGFVVGYVLRELATLLRVTEWERRHDRRLMWRGDGATFRAAVLAKA